MSTLSPTAEGCQRRDHITIHIIKASGQQPSVTQFLTPWISNLSMLVLAALALALGVVSAVEQGALKPLKPVLPGQ